MGITYKTLVWEDKLNNLFNVFFDKEKREKEKGKEKERKSWIYTQNNQCYYNSWLMLNIKLRIESI